MTTTRQPALDNAKFFAVTLVVVGHMLEPMREASHAAWTTYQWMYTFHVPVLVFLAGITSRPQSRGADFWGLGRTILFPYVVFSALYGLAVYVSAGSFHVDLLTPYWLLWFLLSLFFWRLSLVLAARFSFAWLAAVALALAAGAIDAVDQRLSLSRTFLFLPFFLLGHQHGQRILTTLRQPMVRVTSVAILVAAWFAFRFWLDEFNCRWFYGNVGYRELGVDWAVGVGTRSLVLAAAVLVGGAFLALVPIANRWFTELGTRTLQSYLLHGLFVIGLVHFVPADSYRSVFAFPLAIALGSMLSLVLSTRAVQRMASVLLSLPNRPRASRGALQSND